MGTDGNVIRNQNKRRIMIFSIFTLIFLGLLGTAYIRSREDNILLLLLLTPGLSALAARLITKEGTKDLFLRPYFRKNGKWYLAAWILTPLFAFMGAAIYFFIFQEDFQPLSSLCAREEGIKTTMDYFRYLGTMLPLAVLVNPLMGLVQCLGEEAGWRGYLLPKLLEFMKPWKAVLLTGVIWGLWHAPVIACGFNYGTAHPIAGIFAMVVFSTVLGCIQGWLFFKTGSIWSCVVFHAALNGMDLFSPSALFMGAQVNPFLGPDPTGILGGIIFAGLAAAAFGDICRKGSEHIPV